MSLAPALNALAFDIQDNLRFAVPAVNRKVLRLGLRRYSEQFFIALADRTGDPSICHFDYTTITVSVQQVSSFFVLVFQKIYMVSSSNKY